MNVTCWASECVAARWADCGLVVMVLVLPLVMNHAVYMGKYG